MHVRGVLLVYTSTELSQDPDGDTLVAGCSSGFKAFLPLQERGGDAFVRADHGHAELVIPVVFMYFLMTS